MGVVRDILGLLGLAVLGVGLWELDDRWAKVILGTLTLVAVIWLSPYWRRPTDGP